MATYPKKIKPPRSYPANVLHGIRVRINQVNPDPKKGEIALVLNKPVNIGTIPGGSHVVGGQSQVATAFAPAATVDVGSQTVPGGFAASATIAPGTVAVVQDVVGTLSGYVAADTPVWVLMGGAQATAGVADIVIPFYVQGD
jgi:hypothetical protein